MQGRKMYLEQKTSHRTGLRGWEISSLIGKKFSVARKQRQSRGPRLGPRSRALTGSLLVGLSPSLLILALQPTLAVMEEVSRPCSSSPPRERAGPDRLIAPCPVLCPTRLVFILEQSMLKAWVPPGASHTLAQCGLLCVSR